MKHHIVKKDGYTIKCELSKRRNSRNIRMHFNNLGILKVSLPYYTPYFAAKQFISKNMDWIIKRIELIERNTNTYYYCGNNITLIKENCTNNQSFNYLLKDNVLILYSSNRSLTIEQLFEKWLKIKAAEYIIPKVKKYAEELNLEYNSIKIRNMTSRWGSCSSKKNLSFNLKLMYFNCEVIDYVIIHELCHLIEMNHSGKFWDLVEGLVPNYKEYKKQLNKQIIT